MNEEARSDKMAEIRKDLALTVVREMAHYISVKEERDVIYAPTEEITQAVTRMAQSRISEFGSMTHIDTYFDWLDILDDFEGYDLYPLHGVSGLTEPIPYEETTIEERVDIYMLHSAIGTALMKAWCNGVSQEDMEEALMVS